MNLLRDIVGELLGMFLSDGRLAAAVLALVALTAALVDVARVAPPIGGTILLFGCLAILVEATRREARRRSRP